MTRRTVVWDPDVENGLAEKWVTGDSKMRSTLTAIADWLDTNLTVDPDVKGRPLPERSARVIDVPFSIASARAEVMYQVFPDDRMVRIIQLVLRDV